MASHSKLQKPSNVDRFSDLPDSLILLILSKLYLDDAMKFTLSSKRFMPLYKSFTNYDFSDFGIGMLPQRTLNLFKFVDKILMDRTRDLTLERFRFSASGTTDEGHFDDWFRMLIGFNVKVLEFRVNFRRLYELPARVYRCETLQVLKLNDTILVDVPEFGNLSSLRFLQLNRVTFSTQQSVDKLLLMCPGLENLIIQSCSWLKRCRIHISGPALKGLWLDRSAYISEGYPKILIDTVPVLETLCINESNSYDIRSKNEMLSLVNANINIVMRYVLPRESMSAYRDRALALLKQISHVKFLALSDTTLENLSHATAYDFPTFHNLTALELHLQSWTGGSFLPNMLGCSPNLVNLVIPRGLVRCSSYGPDPSRYLWNPPEFVPECLSLHIQNIEIGGFCGFAEELMIVQYLLKHGSALIKMSIDCGSAREQNRLLFNKINKKLLEYHRGSTTCKVDLSYKWKSYDLRYRFS